MKTAGTLTLIAMMAFAASGISSARAANFSIPDFEIEKDGTYTASVSIAPGAGEMFNYKGFQFDLVLTSDITVVSDKTVLGSPLQGFTLDSGTTDTGATRLVVYTNGNAVNATSNLLTIEFKAAAEAAAGPNTINITNVVFSTPEGMDRVGTTSSFVITVKETEGPEPLPETPTIPADAPQGMYGNANGTFVSALKIREGNQLTMGLNEPQGGYEDGWHYLWSDPAAAKIGDTRIITVDAALYGEAANSGKGMAISPNVYTIAASNLAPDGSTFWEKSLPTATVNVYKRPAAPTQLLRKGDGTSCTFVVIMTPLGNQEILDLGYQYVYGYTDASGVMHEMTTTPLRYCHTTKDIYNDSSLTFWAYSVWHYADGSVVTSGMRFLDGAEDPDFDASVFDATRASEVGKVMADDGLRGVYTLEGRYVGSDESRLQPGLYIVRAGGETRKIIVK